jgi:hypothetical protein
VPDGASGASAVLSNGSSVPLTVAANMYFADFSRAGALPTQISWTSEDGQHQVADTHLPQGVATEDCVAPPHAEAARAAN